MHGYPWSLATIFNVVDHADEGESMQFVKLLFLYIFCCLFSSIGPFMVVDLISVLDYIY